MSDKLVYYAVVNFVSRTIENGAKLDNIVKKTIEFFSRDDILSTKRIMVDITIILA